MQVPLKGSLAELNFVEVLKDAAKVKLTGMVRVENGPIIKVVYLHQGRIAFASSNEKSDRLNEVLKRAGKLTAEQIEHAQARLRPNISMGKTLLELGYISTRDLLWGAKIQVERILHHLIFLSNGRYEILAGPLPKEVVSLNISVSEMILRAILSAKDRKWILQKIGSPDAIYEPVPDFAERNAADKLPVDAVVSKMNGKRTLDEIAELAGMEAFEVCKTAVALEVLDLARQVHDQSAQMSLEVTEEKTPEDVPEKVETNISLGQVMQIPTIEELMTTDDPKSADEVVDTAINQPVAEEIEQSGVGVDKEEVGSVVTEEKSVEEPAKPFEEKHPIIEAPRPPEFLIQSEVDSASKFEGWRRVASIGSVLALIALIAGWFLLKPNPEADSTPKGSSPTTLEKPKEPGSGTGSPESPSDNGSLSTEKLAAPKPESETALTMVKSGQLAEAAKLWNLQVGQQPSGFTIQLVLACQEKTVTDAFATLSYSENLFIIPILFNGRLCYRVLYGNYPTEAKARADLGNLPVVFRNQISPPKVIPLTKIVK